MQHEPQTEVSFKDTDFLQAFGLSEHNALEYFAQSQFYDPSCINEQLKMQARFNELQATMLDLTQMQGIEFSLWSFTLSPSLFVIRKSMRYSPENTELLAVFYIVEGSIFEAPTLDKILQNRMITSLHFLEKAVDQSLYSYQFHPHTGYHWQSDEKLIEKQRDELLKGTDSIRVTKNPIGDMRQEINYLQQVDQIIQNLANEEEPEIKRKVWSSDQSRKRAKS